MIPFVSSSAHGVTFFILLFRSAHLGAREFGVSGYQMYCSFRDTLGLRSMSVDVSRAGIHADIGRVSIQKERGTVHRAVSILISVLSYFPRFLLFPFQLFTFFYFVTLALIRMSHVFWGKHSLVWLGLALSVGGLCNSWLLFLFVPALQRFRQDRVDVSHCVAVSFEE